MTFPDLPADVVKHIQLAILDWYGQHRRDLPWRDNPDPYAKFVSEIMLQQTGVERVQPAFEKFLDRFPDFESLAHAPVVDVLRRWAGLGYNRRAIRLQECARVICRDHLGVLPRSPSDLARLPGVGPYTVAAIQSFVFGEDIAALDTNIRRVIGRVWFGESIADREIQTAATRLLPATQGAAWNQALMDFGSLQCTTNRPACPICPIRDWCRAFSLSSPPLVQRRIAEQSEPYRGSRRYIRGRIVALLRDRSAGELAPLSDLERALIDYDIAIDRVTLVSILDSLAHDGLCQVKTDSSDILVGPPI